MVFPKVKFGPAVLDFVTVDKISIFFFFDGPISIVIKDLQVFLIPKVSRISIKPSAESLVVSCSLSTLTDAFAKSADAKTCDPITREVSKKRTMRVISKTFENKFRYHGSRVTHLRQLSHT